MDKKISTPLGGGYFGWSGRWDLNPGPLAPHASALAGLRHAPIGNNGRPYRYGNFRKTRLYRISPFTQQFVPPPIFSELVLF